MWYTELNIFYQNTLSGATTPGLSKLAIVYTFKSFAATAVISATTTTTTTILLIKITNVDFCNVR